MQKSQSSAEPRESALFFDVGEWVCTLPIRFVVEIMRPLFTKPIHGAPSFVRGLAIVRGAPIPVVDAARLLGMDGLVQDDAAESRDGASRFIVFDAGSRRAVLAVRRVHGIRVAPDTSFGLPPLLHGAGAGAVKDLGVLDAEVVAVLDAARLVPAEVWRSLSAGGST